MGFDHSTTTSAPLYLRVLVANVYNGSYQMTGFTHDWGDLDYFTSIYDAPNKRVYVVPFHFGYGNKAFVFNYNS